MHKLLHHSNISREGHNYFDCYVTMQKYIQEGITFRQSLRTQKPDKICQKSSANIV